MLNDLLASSNDDGGLFSCTRFTIYLYRSPILAYFDERFSMLLLTIIAAGGVTAGESTLHISAASMT